MNDLFHLWTLIQPNISSFFWEQDVICIFNYKSITIIQKIVSLIKVSKSGNEHNMIKARFSSSYFTFNISKLEMMILNTASWSFKDPSSVICDDFSFQFIILTFSRWLIQIAQLGPQTKQWACQLGPGSLRGSLTSHSIFISCWCRINACVYKWCFIKE